MTGMRENPLDFNLERFDNADGKIFHYLLLLIVFPISGFVLIYNLFNLFDYSRYRALIVYLPVLFLIIAWVELKKDSKLQNSNKKKIGLNLVYSIIFFGALVFVRESTIIIIYDYLALYFLYFIWFVLLIKDNYFAFLDFNGKFVGNFVSVLYIYEVVYTNQLSLLDGILIYVGVVGITLSIYNYIYVGIRAYFISRFKFKFKKYENLKDAVIKGFENANDYYDALNYEIDNFEIYSKFKYGGFPDLEKFRNICIDLGYDKYSDYNESLNFKIEVSEIYYDKIDYLKEIGYRNYDEYLKYDRDLKKYEFNNLDDFKKYHKTLVDLGYLKFNDYILSNDYNIPDSIIFYEIIEEFQQYEFPNYNEYEKNIDEIRLYEFDNFENYMVLIDIVKKYNYKFYNDFKHFHEELLSYGYEDFEIYNNTIEDLKKFKIPNYSEYITHIEDIRSYEFDNYNLMRENLFLMKKLNLNKFYLYDELKNYLIRKLSIYGNEAVGINRLLERVNENPKFNLDIEGLNFIWTERLFKELDKYEYDNDRGVVKKVGRFKPLRGTISGENLVVEDILIQCNNCGLIEKEDYWENNLIDNNCLKCGKNIDIVGTNLINVGIISNNELSKYNKISRCKICYEFDVTDDYIDYISSKICKGCINKKSLDVEKIDCQYMLKVVILNYIQKELNKSKYYGNQDINAILNVEIFDVFNMNFDSLNGLINKINTMSCFKEHDIFKIEKGTRIIEIINYYERYLKVRVNKYSEVLEHFIVKNHELTESMIESKSYNNEKLVIDASNVAHHKKKKNEKILKNGLNNLVYAIEAAIEYGFKNIKLIGDNPLNRDLGLKQKNKSLENFINDYNSGDDEIDIEVQIVESGVDADELILYHAKYYNSLILSNDKYEEYWKRYSNKSINQIKINYEIYNDKGICHFLNGNPAAGAPRKVYIFPEVYGKENEYV